MNRLSTALLFFLGFSALASAQSTFSVSATEVWKIAPHNVPSVDGHFTITNLTNNTHTFRWTRNVINITGGCETQVCDINLCYTPPVSTRFFELEPNATGPMTMYFLNYDSIVGANGVIHMKMVNEDVPTDSVVVTFLFTSPLSSTDNPLPKANVKIFPNPTTDYFMLDNADAVHRVRLFSLDSREVARFTATPGEQYSVAEQPAGAYIIVLEDKEGRVFQAAELVRR